MDLDFDDAVGRIALGDKTQGLLHGKLGASIYFYVRSAHDENSEAYQMGKKILRQVIEKLLSTKNVGLSNGLGICIGRIERILWEMRNFLFSLHPTLHPNRFCQVRLFARCSWKQVTWTCWKPCASICMPLMGRT